VTDGTYFCEGGGTLLNLTGVDVVASLDFAEAFAVFGSNTGVFGYNYLRVVMSGVRTTGVDAAQNAVCYVAGVAGTDSFSGCTDGAIWAEENAYIFAWKVTGSVGNTVGLVTVTGGIIEPFQSTVTGSLGDVRIDAQTPKPYALAGTIVRSSAGMPGTRLIFAGGWLGTASAQETLYLPLGGMRGTVAGVNNTPTPQNYPVAPGGLCKQLYINVDANEQTVPNLITVMKNGVATPLSAFVNSSSTGTFKDTSDSFTFNDGDTIDIQGQSGGGGATNVLTLAVGVQIQ
jgi:hypothetical protein